MNPNGATHQASLPSHNGASDSDSASASSNADALDTSRARAAILARIRAQQQRPALAHAEDEAEVEATLRARRRGPLPNFGHDAVGRFVEQARELQSTVALVARRADAPAAVLEFLQQHDLPRSASAWNTLADLDWSGMQMAWRACAEDDLVGITESFAAIAETGSLVLVTGAQMHASTHLYPETHIALLRASRIRMHYEEVFDLLREELGELPRSVNIVSGPSRTGDIEQTIVLGAHGPYRVHVIVLRDE